jgi:hypothetical protein
MKFQEAEIKRGDRGRRLTYEDAMGNDLINAIIELVTNADDSYCALEDRGALHAQGSIRIEIERHTTEPTKLVVRDRAGGMSFEEMKRFIQTEGELHREFNQSNRIRGMFGSGAKEVTHFGPTIYESIKDNVYTRYEIPRGGGSKTDKPRIGHESADEHREKLGIPSTGTVVTIDVDSQQFTIPQYNTLRQRLQATPQLQSVLQDQNRRVVLKDLNHPENEDVLKVVEPTSTLIIDQRELGIIGYQEIMSKLNLPVKLTLKRAEEPLNDMAGILIKAGRTIFERDQFGQANQAHADLFYGDLDCPFLWRLIAEAEARDADNLSLLPSENPSYQIERNLNPSRPVSRRRRSGLDRTHPFISRLRSVVQTILNSERQRSVSQQAQHEKPIIDENLRQELSEIADKLGEFLQGEYGNDRSKDLYTIPSSLSLQAGENKSFTVYATPDLVRAHGKLVEAVVIQGEDVVELDESNKELIDRNGNFSVGFTIVGKNKGSASLLIALGKEDTSIKVFVGQFQDPGGFAGLIGFDREMYTVRADGKRKAKIQIFVKDSLRQRISQKKISLRITGAERISEAARLEVQTPTLEKTENNLWVGYSKIIGGRGGSGLRGKLIAFYGGEEASAIVRITDEEDDRIGNDLPFRIEYEPGIEARNRRYNWKLSEEPKILQILTEHPSVQPYFKRNSQNKVQNTSELIMVTREIAASAVAFRNINEKYWPEDTRPEEIIVDYEKTWERALRYLYKK